MTPPAGRINKLFGTDGGVMLTLYAAFPEDFDAETPLLVVLDGLEVPLWCCRFERRGASGAVAAFDDFDTERRAMELLGQEFRLPKADCEDEEEEFCLEDLIGFRVTAIESGGHDEQNAAEIPAPEVCRHSEMPMRTDDGSRIRTNREEEYGTAQQEHRRPKRFEGTLTDFYDSDANPLFEIDFGAGPVLVPAAEEFIARIDFEKRTMKLVVPEGLVGIQQ